MGAIRKGLFTTEFWVTSLGMVGSLAAVFAGIVTGPVALVAVAVSGSAYAISRGITKAKAGDYTGATTEIKNVIETAKSVKRK